MSWLDSIGQECFLLWRSGSLIIKHWKMKNWGLLKHNKNKNKCVNIVRKHWFFCPDETNCKKTKDQTKRFGQKNRRCCSGSGSSLLLFHLYFGLRLFISTFCCRRCCCCCAAPTSVWAACPSSQCAVANCGRQPVEVAVTSSGLFVTFYWADSLRWGGQSKKATTRQRSVADVHLETRSRATPLAENSSFF